MKTITEEFNLFLSNTPHATHLPTMEYTAKLAILAEHYIKLLSPTRTNSIQDLPKDQEIRSFLAKTLAIEATTPAELLVMKQILLRFGNLAKE